MRKLLVFTCLYVVSMSISAQRDSSLVILQHANLIDGISNHPLLNVTVILGNGKIKDIQQHSSTSVANGIVIDTLKENGFYPVLLMPMYILEM
ncbi:MAG: hypothetical protein ACM3VS_03270 [Candidatus Dadabacteria bacterium]